MGQMLCLFIGVKSLTPLRSRCKNHPSRTLPCDYPWNEIHTHTFKFNMWRLFYESFSSIVFGIESMYFTIFQCIIWKTWWWFIIFTCFNVMFHSNVLFSFQNLGVIVIFNDISCKFLLCKFSFFAFWPIAKLLCQYFVKLCAFFLYQLSLFILPIVIMWIIILKTLKVNPLQKNIIITCLMTKKWYYICHTLFQELHRQHLANLGVYFIKL